MSLKNKMFAEMLGTAWLVLGGCGTAVFAASAGMGALGVALAFGLSLLTMAYAIGPISGCHINPAVTLGLVAGKKFCARQAVPYIIAQVAGAFLGGWIICMIAQGAGTDITSFASNGFGDLSPGGYSMKAVFIAEAVLTFFFLFIIMRSTKDEKLVGFAPIPIGLSLALIHMISIPISNTSVNPARSTSQAFFDGAGAIDQLWLFWAAPILGAVVAGLLARCMCCSKEDCCDDKKSCCDGK